MMVSQAAGVSELTSSFTQDTLHVSQMTSPRLSVTDVLAVYKKTPETLQRHPQKHAHPPRHN